MYSFTWDPVKASSNLKKHEVSFEEAQTVFSDMKARLLDDPDHSEEEDRLVLLGFSSKPRLLVVCHTYRRRGEEIRIISARKATKHEAKQYGSFE